MRTRSMILLAGLVAFGASLWLLWPTKTTDAPVATAAPAARAVSSATPDGVESVPQVVSKGADAATVRELPPPIVVNEPEAPPPRELPRDEPRQTRWGTLNLRPPEDK